MKIVTASPKETISLGRKFSSLLRKGDVVVLEGPLGAGKTTFIKGILSGLGIKKDMVISPSFTLIREYKAPKMMIYHIDLYRIENKKELINLGYQDYFYSPGGLSLIEWGQRIEGILPEYLKVRISFLGQNKRNIDMSTKGYLKKELIPL